MCCWWWGKIHMKKWAWAWLKYLTASYKDDAISVTWANTRNWTLRWMLFNIITRFIAIATGNLLPMCSCEWHHPFAKLIDWYIEIMLCEIGVGHHYLSASLSHMPLNLQLLMQVQKDRLLFLLLLFFINKKKKLFHFSFNVKVCTRPTLLCVIFISNAQNKIEKKNKFTKRRWYFSDEFPNCANTVAAVVGYRKHAWITLVSVVSSWLLSCRSNAYNHVIAFSTHFALLMFTHSVCLSYSTRWSIVVCCRVLLFRSCARKYIWSEENNPHELIGYADGKELIKYV